MELITEPSINAATGVSAVMTSEPCWMDPIIDFLVKDRIPDDEKEARRVSWVTVQYWLSANRKLY